MALAFAMALVCGAVMAAPTRALVILVNFPDAVSTVPAEQYRLFFNDPAYSAANAPKSVRGWLFEASRGKADIQFTVTDWLTLPHDVAHYRALDAGNLPNDGPIALLNDAVDALDRQGFDFRPYDNDGDGRIDLLGLVHRGSDPAFGTGIAPTWSTVPNLDPPIEVDGVRAERAWMITESDPAFGTMTTLGGVIHEMVGHALCGLPDLYNWLPGSWAQMWGGNAFRPLGFDAFSRHACDWGRVVDIDAPSSLRLTPASEGGEAYRIWIDPYRESEYFLLEYRKQGGLDQGLPGSGLLIWHVDLSADQSNFLRLEQADGRDDLRDTSGFGAADAGDPYPGTAGNRAFTPTSTPDSRSRRGQATGIRIENVEPDPASGGVTVAVTPASKLSGITLAYDQAYPGFAWNWRPSAGNVVGERTAVRFTTPSAGRLIALKLKYWGPPFSGTGPQYDLAVYGDFLPGNTLPAQPMRRVQGRLEASAGSDNWFTVTLASPLEVSAGESFVVDLGWDAPMIAIDYTGKNDGRSYYRAPEAGAYSPMAHDLRIRALIDTGEHEAPGLATFQDGVLTLPRVAIDQSLVDATSVRLKLAGDGRWDMLGYTLDRYVLGNAASVYKDGVLTVSRVQAPAEASSYLDITFQIGSDGRFTLSGGRREQP
ncbi:MAG: M6 family metalloprotease domain-containing protein [Betaproteobacteria bacterium]|nr:M6 family metalloprotease domain-containing protein [Betaproteobacteria bacterium]